MATRTLLALALGICLTPFVRGQDAKPVNATEFLIQAIESDAGEIARADLAKTRATNAKVKEFAEKMREDHTKTRKQLTELASDLKVAVAGGVGKNQKELLDQLGKAEGKDFDQAYIRSEVENHQKAVQLFTAASKSVENAQMQKFARDTLPHIQKHLEEAQSIAKLLQQQ